jgi:hypothetical protein
LHYLSSHVAYDRNQEPGLNGRHFDDRLMGSLCGLIRLPARRRFMVLFGERKGLKECDAKQETHESWNIVFCRNKHRAPVIFVENTLIFENARSGRSLSIYPTQNIPDY